VDIQDSPLEVTFTEETERHSLVVGMLQDAMRDLWRAQAHVLLDELIRGKEFSMTINLDRAENTTTLTVVAGGPKKAEEDDPAGWSIRLNGIEVG